MKTFNVLHTSDWHLGHQLHHRRREDEFLAFLNWLENAIKEYQVDVLIVTGDIFDSSLPGPVTQKLYYDFLLKAASAGARHIIITAGNHDSPALITAAGPLLARMQIHVIGNINGEGENEIRILKDENGEPELIVCAVPHIRERDIRVYQPGEKIEEKESLFLAAIKDYYAKIAVLAEKLRQNRDIPVIATGHLFVSSATPTEEERNLYIGNLGQISADIFPPVFDYIALGHIHKAQTIDKRWNMKYSGSPLPMSFAEAKYEKEVTLIKFTGKSPEIFSIPVPRFRKMDTICGNKEEILNEIRKLLELTAEDTEPTWIEIKHNGEENPFDLQTLVNEAAQGSQLQVLCIKTDYRPSGMTRQDWTEHLENISPEEIFQMRIENENLSEDQKNELMFSFQELLKEHYETSGNPEK